MRSLVLAILGLVLAGSDLFLGLSLRAAAPLVAESIPESHEYFLRTWELDDGLINNNVTGIAQSPDGFLWIGTLGGLQRFDGVRFTSYLSDANPGMTGDRLHSVLLAKDGSLWIGSEGGGVTRRVGNRFEAMIPDSHGRQARSIAEDDQGGLWVGFAANWVVRIKEGQVAKFGSEKGVLPGNEVDVCASLSGKIWYGDSNGFGLFDGSRFNPVDPQGGHWSRLAHARDGGVWAVRDNHLIRYQDDGTKQTIAELGNVSVQTLFEDSSGTLWIGSRNAGLIRYRNGSFLRVPVSDNLVNAVFEDREHNLWVGTAGGGLNRLRARQFYLRQVKDGLSFNDIYSMCMDTQGRLWMTGRYGSLVRAIDATNRAFATPAFWDSAPTMTICPDSKGGGIWLGTLGGVNYWGDRVNSGKSWALGGVTSLLEDSQSNLWVGTIREGLICCHDGIIDRLSKANGFAQPRALCEDPAGRIWVGTEEGFLFYHAPDVPLPSSPAPTWSDTGANGFVKVPLPGNKPLGQIQFIVPDGDQTLWIGTLTRGLFRLRGGRLSHPPLELGLPLYDIRSLSIDPRGNFWIGTTHGLIRMIRSEMEAAMAGRQNPSIRYVYYGPNDGLPNLEFAFGFRNATTRTRDGHIWFATNRGALEVVPKEKEEAPISNSQVLIEEVRVGEQTLDPNSSQQLILPPRPGLIQIRYTLPQLSRPGQARFRYRLSADDNEFLSQKGEKWTNVGDQRVASFSRLPPGNYRFEVAAAESGEPWSEQAASVQIRIGAAWWQTFGFRILALVCGSGLLGWSVRKIVRRRMMERMRAVEQENAVERERTRIARDMHDQLGASLTQIAITSKLLKLDPAGEIRAHSDAIAEIARQSVEALDEIVWAVDPVNDNYPALLGYLGQFAIDFLGAAGIGCELDIPVDLPKRPLASHERHHLFLAIKESLNNIAKHSGATQVTLRAENLGARIRITLQDNGRGLPETIDRVGSDGLRNLRARMGELGGEYRLESEPGKGVKSVFELPVR